MTASSSRGFTLIELLAAVVLGLVIGGAAYQLVLSSQRSAQAQAEQIGLQDNVRSGLLFLANELRAIGYSETPSAAGAIPDPDLIAIGTDSITYRAMRGIGFTCSLDGVSGNLVLRNSSTYHALRTPAVTDRVLLFLENDAATGNDDAWLHAGIAAPPVAQACPDGGAGLRLRLAFSDLSPAAVFAKMRPGGPVRIYEVVQVRSYQSEGRAWLGMRSVSAGATLQPIVGPLSNGTGAEQGLQLSYRNAGDNITPVPTEVRAIEATLIGLTAAPVHRGVAGVAAVDSLSLSTRVWLRNAPRP